MYECIIIFLDVKQVCMFLKFPFMTSEFDIHDNPVDLKTIYTYLR